MLEVHWPVVIRVARDIGLHPCGPFFCVRLNPFEQVVSQVNMKEAKEIHTAVSDLQVAEGNT